MYRAKTRSARRSARATRLRVTPGLQRVSVTETVEEELLNLAVEWDRAMVENDPEAIGQFMADDWTIVGPDGSVDNKMNFLGLVKSGALTHDVMESHEMRIRVYGDAAVVIARGISGGKFQGQSVYLVERVSSVFVQQAGRWRCVLTHLSSIGDK